MHPNSKIGLFGIGLDTYWSQFDGLKNRLEGYQNTIARKIESFGATVVDAGLVDTPEKAHEAALMLKSADVELVFLYVSTYALSSTVLPVVQRVGVPVILLNLQPTPAMNYAYINSLADKREMTGEWLANCQACSIPEIAAVLNRSKLRYEIVTGHLEDPEAWHQIKAWTRAASVACAMRKNRMGILGHYYCGMLDVYTDLMLQSSTFGTHIELVEMCEVAHHRKAVSPEEVEAKIAEFHKTFEVVAECSAEELERAARTSIALDKLVAAHNLGSLAYYYEGSAGSETENIVTSVIAGNTCLTGKGIPVAGECEVKNVQAMKILSLFGAGGSFSEFYGLDFNDDVVLLGHDGPAHFAIAEGAVKLVPLPVYHGKPGKGLSIQMSVRHGAVTLLSVIETVDGIALLTAEGESVKGEVLHIGNTNSRYRFPLSAKQFIEKWSKAGPSHHCAIGVGHLGEEIEKLGILLDIPVIKVC